MKLALVHDWLTGMRGGERVLEAICELVPHATLFTLLNVPGKVSPTIARHELRNTTLQPLYSRLSGADQNKVFAPVPGRRISPDCGKATISISTMPASWRRVSITPSRAISPWSVSISTWLRISVVP